MELTIGEIAEATNAQLADASLAQRVATGVSWDSRTVEPGDLYIAFVGERVDGHDYARAAVEAGAAALLVSHDLAADAKAAAAERGAAVLRVDDCMAALTALAACWRTHLHMPVIGVTGSSGKTTTKNLIRDVLASKMPVTATKANQNNELGVPATLLSASESDGAVVVEMGMRGLGQIAALCEIAHPTWGIITNVGVSHMELLGSRDNIARAKAELFEALPDGEGVAFINGADDYADAFFGYAHLQERGVNTAFFIGSEDWNHADDMGIFETGEPIVWATEIELDEMGRPTFFARAVNFDDTCDEAVCQVSLQLTGLHNVSNACSAIAIGMKAGMTLEECAQALGQAQPEKGRAQTLCAKNGALVLDDAYNANTDSMCASLRTFAAYKVPGRRIAVLGDMGELGAAAEEGHALVGACAAECGIDWLVLAGEFAHIMADGALNAGMPAERIHVCATTDEALEALRTSVAPEDAVLVKASHFMQFEKIVEGLVG